MSGARETAVGCVCVAVWLFTPSLIALLVVALVR